jgi:uncharacterized protein (TIGR03437 family)
VNRSHPIPTLLALAALAALAAAPAAAQTLLQFNQTSFNFSAQAGATASQEQPLFILTSTGASLTYTATIQQTGNWLSASPMSGTAPIAVRLIVNPTGLAQGTYNGTITITATGATNSPQNITVILTVGTGTTTSPLVANPTSLNFSFTMGGLVPDTQTIAVTSTTTAQSFNVSVATDAGGNWLAANPAAATTPATVTVAVAPGGLAQGTYTGRVTLTPPGLLAPPLTVPVTLTVSATPELKVTALQPFNFQTGTTPPAAQTLSLTSTGAALPFSATVTTQTGGAWLVVSPLAGATPADLTVSISQNALAGMTFGTYSATITINAPNASNPTVTVPVTLNISISPFLTVSPASFSFTVQPGGALPQAQNLTVSGTSANIPLTVLAAAATAPNWLTVTPTAGVTPATFAVSINANAQSLLPGTYNGVVTVNAPTTANPVTTIPVTLTVSNTPALIASPAALFFNFQTGRSNPNPQTVQVSSSGIPAQYSVTFTTAKGGQWLQVSPGAGSTPSILTVAVNPTGLAPDTYTGTITLTPAASGAAAVTINVTLTVSNNPLLNVSPPVVSFSLPQGAGTTAQNVALTSTGDQVNFTVTFTTTSCGANWLFVAPISGTTPANLQVFVVPGTLAIGVCTGTITVSAQGANSQTIPVTLTITSGATLRAEPGSLSFTQTQGGAAAAAQTVSLTASGTTAVNFAATATTSSCGNWLAVDPVNGATPAQLRVSTTAVSMVAGTPCTGQITVVAPSATNSPLNIPVSLSVVAAQTLAANPASLAFSFQLGSTAPAGQSVQVTSTPSPVSFTVTAATQSGGDWLTAAATAGTTPATVTVGIRTQNLTTAGTYNGTVTLTSPTAGNSPLTIAVTLTVTAAPAPRVTTVRNAASYVPGAIAPGEMLYFEGANLGPQTLTTLRLNAQGLVDTTLAGVRVLFDGIPSALVYVWHDRLVCIAPYGIAGRVTVRVQVEYQGQLSTAIDFQVTDAAPGVFTLNQQGSGQGAILNQDYSVNGPRSATTHPAAAGSVVMIYATGEGQTLPAGVDGKVNNTAILPRPLLPVTVTIGGREAEVTYAGAAPGYVSGALQINARIPPGTPSGGAVPVTVQVGSRPAQAGVTLAVE